MPINFIRMTREDWAEEGQRDLVKRVVDNCKDILKNAEPINLHGQMIKEMDSIVDDADKHLR